MLIEGLALDAALNLDSNSHGSLKSDQENHKSDQ